MDSVGCAGGAQGGGGILKELIDSPMAPHNKIKDKKGGGGKKNKDKECGEGGVGGVGGAGGCQPSHDQHHHHHHHNQGNGGAAFIMVGNIAGGILGG